MRTCFLSSAWHRNVLKGFAILFLAPLSGLAQAPSLVDIPDALSFFHQLPPIGIPENVPILQTFTVSTSNGAALSFTATASVTTPAGANWLSVSPTAGTTPTEMTVSVNPTGLAPDSCVCNSNTRTYTGTITISAPGASNSPQTVQVTVDVRGLRQLIVSQNVLSFGATVGGGAPPQDITLLVTGAHPGPLLFTTAVITLDGGDWLAVSPATGTAPTAPGGLTISINPPADIPEGSYAGSISIRDTNPNSLPLLVQVPLTMSATPVIAPEIALIPSSLQFVPNLGSSPPAQSFQVQNTGSGGVGWTATVDTQSGGDWLSASPATDVAPSTLTVTVNSADLPVATYSGTITIAALPSVNASNSPQVLTVTLAVGAPAIGQDGVVNGASFSKEAVVSPASIASLFGVNLATTTELAAEFPLPTTLADTQVLVNEIPVPLFFVSPTQINFQMPSEVSGPTVQAVVVSNRVRGLTATVNVAPEVPGIFTATPGGTGQGAVLLANSDVIAAPVGSIPDRTSQPVSRGDFISIFATGLGETNPPVETGEPGASTSPFNETTMTPVVLIGGIAAEVPFSAMAPGFVGLYQVNVRIPEAAPVGDAVSLQIQIGGQSSNTATIAVQ